MLGAGTTAQQFLVTLVFGGGEVQRGLGLRDLLARLLDLGVLRLYLGSDVGGGGFGLGHLCISLVQGRAIVAVVDTRQHGARIYKLVVIYRDIDNAAGYLGGDRDGSGVDEGVVRRFVLTRMKPPEDRTCDD